jgi:hypothetical protein
MCGYLCREKRLTHCGLGLPALSAYCVVQNVARFPGCYWSCDTFLEASKWPEIVKIDELKLSLMEMY